MSVEAEEEGVVPLSLEIGTDTEIEETEIEVIGTGIEEGIEIETGTEIEIEEAIVTGTEIETEIEEEIEEEEVKMKILN